MAKISDAEARYSLFQFQNHLVEIINLSAHLFVEKMYLDSFLTLSQIYSDVSGFLGKKEREELDKIFYELSALATYFERSKGKPTIYQMTFPLKLVEFRKKLMSCMSRHQLLIPIEVDGFRKAVFK